MEATSRVQPKRGENENGQAPRQIQVFQHQRIVARQSLGRGHVHSTDLRQAGDARFNPVYATTGTFSKQFLLLGQAGPGPYQAHVTEDYVDELRSLIQSCLAQDTSVQRNALRIHKVSGQIWRVFRHGPELDQREEAPVLADSGLGKDGPANKQVAQQCQHQKHRRQQNHPDDGQHHVKSPHVADLLSA